MFKGRSLMPNLLGITEYLICRGRLWAVVVRLAKVMCACALGDSTHPGGNDGPEDEQREDFTPETLKSSREES
jgi:hypothetical protein